MTKETIKAILQNYMPTAQEKQCHKWLVELYSNTKISYAALNKRLTNFAADNKAETLLIQAVMNIRTELETKDSAQPELYRATTPKQNAAVSFIEKHKFFTFDDVLSYCGSRSASQRVLREFVSAGKIKRLDRGAYSTVPTAQVPHAPV